VIVSFSGFLVLCACDRLASIDYTLYSVPKHHDDILAVTRSSVVSTLIFGRNVSEKVESEDGRFFPPCRIIASAL